MVTRRHIPAPLGTQVAREILTGDVSLARSLACGVCSWSVAEARGISGAVREANRRWNAGLDVWDFFN